LFNFAWFTDVQNSLGELKNLAMNEDWDYKLTPTGKLPILSNYIFHTFAKIKEEDKIEQSNGYCIFNTGLVTENQEEIYAFFEKNKHPNTTISWFFIGWRKASDRDLVKFSKLPDAANYFDDPSELIYDTKLELRVNIDHIIKIISKDFQIR
jgi:hypothetical protein